MSEELNGIKIDISQEEFFKQPKETREWMIFAGMAGLAREVRGIKKHGCSWAKNYTRKRSMKDTTMSAVFGFLGGVVAVLGKTIWK